MATHHIRTLALSIGSMMLASCGIGPPEYKFYVLIPPDKEPSAFLRDLEELAGKEDMSSETAHVTSGGRANLHALEARGNWMRLWSQNLPLSRIRSSQDPACGNYSMDPGQYVLMFWSQMPLFGGGAAVVLGERLEQNLADLGYKVGSKPVQCSTFAKPEGSDR